MSTITEVTDGTFQTDVIESETPAVVDFWAPWCMPCRMMTPILEELAGNNNGKVKFLKLNTDENQSTSIKYGIMSIPSLVFYKGGQEVNRVIGVQPAANLQAELDKIL